MAIRIENFYNEVGASASKKSFDEAAEIENQAELANQFLQIASDVIYDNHSEKENDNNQSADIVHFAGDEIIACFPADHIASDHDKQNN